MMFVDRNLIDKIIEEYKSNNTFKCIKADPVVISVSPDFNIENNKYYSVPSIKRESAFNEIQRLIDEDIIEESREKYASPIFYR